MSTERHAELFMSVLSWWSRYDLTGLLYALTLPVLLYCIKVYMNCQDDKMRPERICKTVGSTSTQSWHLRAAKAEVLQNGDRLKRMKVL